MVGTRSSAPLGPRRSQRVSTNALKELANVVGWSRAGPGTPSSSISTASSLKRRLSDPLPQPGKGRIGALVAFNGSKRSRLSEPLRRGASFDGESDEDEDGDADDSESCDTGPAPSKIPRKTFLTAGLYTDPTLALLSPSKKRSSLPAPSPITDRALRAAKRRSLAAPPPPLLPLPKDEGDFWLEDETDFRLPFDIVHAWEHGLLAEQRSPPSYIRLRTNVYVDRSPYRYGEPAECLCPKKKGVKVCGDDCINKCMSYFCSRSCKCDNVPFSKRKEAKTKIFYTGSRGFGLRAAQPIAKGTFVVEYRGEIISYEELQHRLVTVYKGWNDGYVMSYEPESGDYLDAGLKGNNARFINHACGSAANLDVVRLKRAGDGWDEYEIGLIARRDIKRGEELLYDYKWALIGDAVAQKCACGSPECTGFIGKRSAKELEEELNESLKKSRGQRKSRAGVAMSASAPAPASSPAKAVSPSARSQAKAESSPSSPSRLRSSAAASKPKAMSAAVAILGRGGQRTAAVVRAAKVALMRKPATGSVGAAVSTDPAVLPRRSSTRRAALAATSGAQSAVPKEGTTVAAVGVRASKRVNPIVRAAAAKAKGIAAKQKGIVALGRLRGSKAAGKGVAGGKRMRE